MVSLAAVEGYAAALWPQAAHAVVARPDPRKGEELVLFTTQAGADPHALQAWAQDQGVAELSLPKEIRVVDAIPVLGDRQTRLRHPERPGERPLARTRLGQYFRRARRSGRR